MPLHQFTAAADQATTVTTQLAWRLPHVGMVKQNMANSQSHNAPPMATCVLVRHNCVLLHIASMHLRLHVASGSVNCVAISQVANLFVAPKYWSCFVRLRSLFCWIPLSFVLLLNHSGARVAGATSVSSSACILAAPGDSADRVNLLNSTRSYSNILSCTA